MIRLDKLLTNRGYCSRREAQALVRQERILVAGVPPKAADVKVDATTVTLDGEVLDPERLFIMLHKPAALVCSRGNDGPSIYELFPRRWSLRSPALSSVGRLDKDTTGLLLLTDDGELLHRLTSPKHHVPKVYEVCLRDALKGNEAEIFAAGNLVLEDESEPLAPAKLESLEDRKVLLTITEGRFHQVKRMFLAVGNEVTALHRRSVGDFVLGDLAVGEWRQL